jgi:hypothetical protein
MPFVSGFLRVRRRAGHPDQGLPGEEGGEVDNSLPGIEGPVDPDYGLPEPPPGVWPPPVPAHPIQPAPHDTPPGTIWPSPGRPAHPIAPGGSPGAPSHPIAPGVPTRFWVVAGIPGYGWRYICVDTSLHPDTGLPPSPGHPDQGLPPTAQPKR